MTRPKMILFDYGGTLIYEPNFEPFNGNKVIYPYISENPHNVSLEEFSECLLRYFDEIRALRGDQIEIHEHIFLCNVLEHFDIHIKRIVVNAVISAVLDDDSFNIGILWNTPWQRKLVVVVQFTDIPAVLQCVVPFEEIGERHDLR